MLLLWLIFVQKSQFLRVSTYVESLYLILRYNYIDDRDQFLVFVDEKSRRSVVPCGAMFETITGGFCASRNVHEKFSDDVGRFQDPAGGKRFSATVGYEGGIIR